MYLITGTQKLLTGRKSSCGRYLMYDGRNGDFWPARCRCRACWRLECREDYSKKAAKRMNEDIKLNGLVSFFTLTLDRSKFKDSDEAWSEFATVWNRFNRIVQREMERLGKPKFIYSAILEKHEDSDWPHLHLCCNAYIPTTEKTQRLGERLLGDMWQQAGGGQIVWAMQTPEGVAEYINKTSRISRYTTKELCNVGEYVKRRRRVVWRSRGLVVNKPAKSSVKFLHGYQPFDCYGKNLLTFEEIQAIIEANRNVVLRRDHKYVFLGDVHYEQQAKQSRAVVDAAQFQLSQEGTQGGIEVLASSGGQPSEYAASEAAKSAKVDNQCQNQKAERVGMKTWAEYHSEKEEKTDNTSGGVHCPAYPHCENCILTLEGKQGFCEHYLGNKK